METGLYCDGSVTEVSRVCIACLTAFLTGVNVDKVLTVGSLFILNSLNNAFSVPAATNYLNAFIGQERVKLLTSRPLSARSSILLVAEPQRYQVFYVHLVVAPFGSFISWKVLNRLMAIPVGLSLPSLRAL
jgi:hypothetical protein